jgi:predicted Zn-dependent protease
MCDGVKSSNKEYKNTIIHFHGDEKCTNEFKTAINEDRKEIVYCEKCYQSEFI